MVRFGESVLKEVINSMGVIRVDPSLLTPMDGVGRRHTPRENHVKAK